MLKTFIDSISYTRDKYRKHTINKAYPETDIPYVPKTMKNVVAYKILRTKEGYSPIGLALGPDGAELVRPESVGFFQAKLLEKYENFSELPSELKSPLPRNTLGIFFAEDSFQVKTACQEFSLIDKLQSPNEATFTYQQLSASVQATYYNENGTQFLAGLGYFPVPMEESIHTKTDDAMMFLAYCSTVSYSLKVTPEVYDTNGDRVYGRYCKTAGRRVVVSNGPGHFVFDYFSESFKKASCTECDLIYGLAEAKKAKKITQDLSTSSNSRASRTLASTVCHKMLEESSIVPLLDVCNKN